MGGYSHFNAVGVTSGGDVYVSGITSGSFQIGINNAGVTDLIVSRIDRDGNQRWARQFGTTQRDVAYGIAVTGRGTATVVGATRGELGTNESFLGATPAAGNDDLFMMRFDRDGAQTALRQWGTSAFDEATAVAVNATGTAYIVGSTAGALVDYNRGNVDLVAVKFAL